MTTPAHSPLPWKWMRENDKGQMIPCEPSWKAKQYSGNKYICDANGKKIMGVGEYDIMESDNDDADAAFVIDAVNAYPLVGELLETLSGFLIYSTEHTTRCAFVNRPAAFCTCGLKERTEKASDLLTKARAVMK